MNFIRELKKQESEQISRLEVQLMAADRQEAKAELQSQIAKLREEFKAKRKSIDSRLFLVKSRRNKKYNKPAHTTPDPP